MKVTQAVSRTGALFLDMEREIYPKRRKALVFAMISVQMQHFLYFDRTQADSR